MEFIISYLSEWIRDNPGWVLYFFAGTGMFIAGLWLSRAPKKEQK